MYTRFNQCTFELTELKCCSFYKAINIPIISLYFKVLNRVSICVDVKKYRSILTTQIDINSTKSNVVSEYINQNYRYIFWCIKHMNFERNITGNLLEYVYRLVYNLTIQHNYYIKLKRLNMWTLYKPRYNIILDKAVSCNR